VKSLSFDFFLLISISGPNSSRFLKKKLYIVTLLPMKRNIFIKVAVLVYSQFSFIQVAVDVLIINLFYVYLYS
jgi:hypothetical protein